MELLLKMNNKYVTQSHPMLTLEFILSHPRIRNAETSFLPVSQSSPHSHHHHQHLQHSLSSPNKVLKMDGRRKQHTHIKNIIQ